MNTVKQVVILSAEKSNLDRINNGKRTMLLEQMILDIGLNFEPALGVYKGSEERSFVVVINNNTDLETLKSFAFKNFEQESILYQDSNQEAYLITNGGDVIQLGKLTNVPREVATRQDGYTLMNGQYYTALPRAI